MQFEITGKDCEKVEKFIAQHKNCPMGSAGDHFTYTFIPTGIGMATTVTCSCGQKILLGDFSNHEPEDYDEEKYKVLTKEDIDNKEFEDLAVSILNMKNSRVFRMAYSCEQNFETIYEYAMGVARRENKRILNAILCKNTLSDGKENYVGTDEEKIQKFFAYFEDNIRKEIQKYHCTNQRLMEELGLNKA